jgi:hypothetical protein
MNKGISITSSNIYTLTSFRSNEVITALPLFLLPMFINHLLSTKWKWPANILANQYDAVVARTTCQKSEQHWSLGGWSLYDRPREKARRAAESSIPWHVRMRDSERERECESREETLVVPPDVRPSGGVGLTSDAWRQPLVRPDVRPFFFEKKNFSIFF